MEYEPKSLKGLHEDVIFCECPRCGKNVGISKEAAGKLINCPECGLRYQVPFPEEVEMTRPVEPPSSAPVGEAKSGIIVDPDYMESIHQQLGLIQNALDRITHVLQHIKDDNAF